MTCFKASLPRITKALLGEFLSASTRFSEKGSSASRFWLGGWLRVWVSGFASAGWRAGWPAASLRTV